jgi:hypothetical protein
MINVAMLKRIVFTVACALLVRQLSSEMQNEYCRKNRHLCKVGGYHGGDYEECRLLGCYAVWLL